MDGQTLQYVFTFSEQATRCPRHSLKNIVARYASVATNADIEKIYKEKGINITAGTSTHQLLQRRARKFPVAHTANQV